MKKLLCLFILLTGLIGFGQAPPSHIEINGNPPGENAIIEVCLGDPLIISPQLYNDTNPQSPQLVTEEIEYTIELLIGSFANDGDGASYCPDLSNNSEFDFGLSQVFTSTYSEDITSMPCNIGNCGSLRQKLYYKIWVSDLNSEYYGVDYTLKLIINNDEGVTVEHDGTINNQIEVVFNDLSEFCDVNPPTFEDAIALAAAEPINAQFYLGDSNQGVELGPCNLLFTLGNDDFTYGNEIPNGDNTFSIYPRYGKYECGVNASTVTIRIQFNQNELTQVEQKFGDQNPIFVCNREDAVDINGNPITITPVPYPGTTFSNPSYFILRVNGQINSDYYIEFTNSYTGSLAGLFAGNLSVRDTQLELIYLEDPNAEVDECSIISEPFNLEIVNEYQELSMTFPRSDFTNGRDYDYDNPTDDPDLYEYELTYGAIKNLFIENQTCLEETLVIGEEQFHDYANLTPNGNRPGFTYTMYIDDVNTSGGFTEINATSSTNLDTEVIEFSYDNANGSVYDLNSDIVKTFYFDISSSCNTDYTRSKIPFTVRIFDLDKPILNPEQFFCEPPIVADLESRSTIPGNILHVWDSPIGGERLLSNIDLDYSGNTAYYVSEFGFAEYGTGFEALEEYNSAGRSLVYPFSINEGCSNPEDTFCSSFLMAKNERYVISAWVKENNAEQKLSYQNTSLELTFFFNEINVLSYSFRPKGDIIDGWQRIQDEFYVPSTANRVVITLANSINDSDGIPVESYFDDIRIHPFNSSMKSFVYDSVNYKLMAELDENNYATFYEYDNEGGLVRVKKETSRGVKTIQETRSGNVINNN